MKKVLAIAILSIVLTSLVHALPSDCSLNCLGSRNQNLQGEILPIKKEIGECRRDLLNCLNSEPPNVQCRDIFAKCYEGKKSEIKQKTLQINSNYDRCIDECKENKMAFSPYSDGESALVRFLNKLFE